MSDQKQPSSVETLAHAATADSLEARIRAAIEECRPMLQSDGGDIEFLGMAEGNRARVRLVGACQGCPSAQMTLQGGIESYLRERVPECKGLVVEGGFPDFGMGPPYR